MIKPSFSNHLHLWTFNDLSHLSLIGSPLLLTPHLLLETRGGWRGSGGRVQYDAIIVTNVLPQRKSAKVCYKAHPKST